MKKIIAVILIVILLIGGFTIFRWYENINNSNTENNINNTNAQNKTESIEYSKLSIKEIEEKDYNSYYEKVEEIAKNWITVEKQTNFLTIRLLDTKQNETLLEGTNSIEYNKDYNVSMVNPNEVKNIYYCTMGQDIDYPLIFLLLDDGSVKVIETEEGYKIGKFVAKSIKELENIKEIEQVSIGYPNDSGYIGVVAINEDGQTYELKEAN